MKKERVNVKRLTIKFILCMIYLMIGTILLVGAYSRFKADRKIVPWNETKKVDDYSYIDISKMSEKFAYYENENIGLHFVIEEATTGVWHTYVIAINEDDYDLYKDIIDYTYDKTEKLPDKIRVYGYPTIMSEDLKKMIVNNINNFLPAETKTKIDIDNLEAYLTNSYLDTTKSKIDEFDIQLFFILLLLFIMIILCILTIFKREKVEMIEEL